MLNCELSCNRQRFGGVLLGEKPYSKLTNLLSNEVPKIPRLTYMTCMSIRKLAKVVGKHHGLWEMIRSNDNESTHSKCTESSFFGAAVEPGFAAANFTAAYFGLIA